MQAQLDNIFKPKTIAAIGASNREGTVGYALIKNLLEGTFDGKIYPVNLKHKEIQGLTAYRHIGKVPEQVDLAIIATPAKTVPDVVEECGKAGVGGLLIISAGFAEAGEEGIKMFNDILKKARLYNMRIIGPNCLGFINPNLGINASFAQRSAEKGNIAFISQSGALCTSILDWASEQNVGFSHFVSIGSMLDVGFADLIDYFGMDPNTSCILIYMESLRDARKFMSAARAFARSKPIIVLKAGKSDEGSRAASSHTGTLAGNNAVFDTAFKRAGVIRVETIGQLFDCAQSLAMQPRPKGNRLAIVTNAGGPGVLATDFLVENGGTLAELSPKTLEKMNEFLPAAWSHSNPVDVLGDASAEIYRKSVEWCLKDPNVDGILAILTTQAVTDPTEVAKELVKVAKKSNKTILASWMGEKDVYEARDILEAGKVPSYRFPESAADVFLKMYQHTRNLEMLTETPTAIPHEFNPKRDAAGNLIEYVLKDGRLQLTESEAKNLLKCYNIPVGKHRVASDVNEAKAFAKVIGYPLVMKIASPDIGHKTDVGGVRVGIQNEKELAKNFKDMMAIVQKKRPDAKLDGILIEGMIKKKFELLIGAKKDPIFGPVIVFGQGGVAVEVFKDTRMGLPPLNMALAHRIVRKTRIYPLLQGYRGMPGIDMEELEFTLCKFAYLVMDFPEIKEIDINPYVMDEEGGMILDAHIVLDGDLEKREGHPYDHLVITPYPEEYVKTIFLRNGQEVLLRPIRPEDEPLEAKMLDFLSKQTLYYRFLGYIPTITHDFLSRFTQIDYDREMAIIAEIEDETDGERKMIGVVRIVADAWGENAEYAIVIADPWQRKGLGVIMTDFILEIAKEKGIKKIYGSVLATNKGMLKLFERFGFDTKKEDFESYYAELQLGVEKTPPLNTNKVLVK